jgi:hypothetical protein
MSLHINDVTIILNLVISPCIIKGRFLINSVCLMALERRYDLFVTVLALVIKGRLMALLAMTLNTHHVILLDIV